MSPYGLPILYTLFVWWFSTGLILYLDGLPRATFRWSMAGASAVLAGAFYGLAASSADASAAGAYVAFTSSVLVWGWLEMSFLMGFITGPWRAPCPPGCRGWLRFRYALRTILHHEIALIVAALAVFALTRDGANQVGMGTFVILWAMRQSAKLNVFFGVRNLSEEFLPTHLRYLETFFTRKAMNPLLPVSIAAATAVAAILWQRALAPDATAFVATAFTFQATLLTLAVVEHLFMVIPLPATALWTWGLRSHRADGASQVAAAPAEHRAIKNPLRVTPRL
jgi:putative photosynthetic complex assembly protein 2